MYVPLQQSCYGHKEANPLNRTPTVNRTNSVHLHITTAYIIEAYSNDNVKKNSETMALNSHSWTVQLGTIKVFYLPNYVQWSCFKRIL